MPTRIRPLKPGESPDDAVNQILSAGREGWWNDSEMFGVIARRPELLKSIVPVFEAFFLRGSVEPYLLEMMRIKTGEINDCQY